MNDQRFTALLNLHLDHEISPVESAELEAEISLSPERRHEYRRYCQMQQACAQLFERKRAQAPASLALELALRDAEVKIAAPSRRPAFRPFVAAMAGFSAIAACLAVSFWQSTASSVVIASNTLRATPPTLAPTTPASSPLLATAMTLASHYEPVSLEQDEYQTVATLVRSPRNARSADLPALHIDRDPISPGLAMPGLQPVVVEASALTVNTLPIQSPVQPRVYLSGTQSPATFQFTSFEFQR